MWSKKSIITLIVLIIIAIGAPKVFNQKTDTVQPIEKTAPRNDLVVDTSTTTDTTTNAVKSYLLSEVSLHNKATDCWLAIDGKVINPTDFIAKGLHPNDKIVDGCGKDASAMFAEVKKHDGGKAQAALQKYEIGILK